MNVIISFGKLIVDTGLATPFYNHNRSGVFNESVFKNFHLHLEK
jgi:hypothetical protein